MEISKGVGTESTLDGNIDSLRLKTQMKIAPARRLNISSRIYTEI